MKRLDTKMFRLCIISFLIELALIVCNSAIAQIGLAAVCTICLVWILVRLEMVKGETR